MKLRKLTIIFVLVAIALCMQSASAALTNLENSSYAASVHNWEGIDYFSQDGVTGYVDYTVYQQNFIDNTIDENNFIESTNLSGEYIYAYQVFVDEDSSTEVGADFFRLLYEGNPLAGVLSDIMTLDDGEPNAVDIWGTVDPNGTWYFKEGELIDGKHSFFLLYSSDEGPVAGSYEIGTNTYDMGGTEGQIPEPATVAMLAIGGMSLMRAKTKRKKQ